MKELEQQEKHRLEIKAEKQQIKAIMIGSEAKIPGLKLWSFDLETCKTEEVKLEKSKNFMVGGDNNRWFFESKTNHLYTQALRRETAENAFYNKLGEMLGRPKGPNLHPKKKKRK